MKYSIISINNYPPTYLRLSKRISVQLPLLPHLQPLPKTESSKPTMGEIFRLKWSLKRPPPNRYPHPLQTRHPHLSPTHSSGCDARIFTPTLEVMFLNCKNSRVLSFCRRIRLGGRIEGSMVDS